MIISNKAQGEQKQNTFFYGFVSYRTTGPSDVVIILPTSKRLSIAGVDYRMEISKAGDKSLEIK